MGSGRRAASGEAAQMNDDIDTLSRRMQEMQRLVEEQRGAMAKLALGRRGRGGEGDGLAPTISQVIPTPSHLLGRISPISPRVFPFFARFHRLDGTVPTSRKPEPRAKRQWQGRPNTVSAV